MPEGDTVFVAATRLRRALAGRRVVRSDFRVPAHATDSVAGQTLLDVASRGKHLLFRFDGGVTLHTHFRMDGAWNTYAPGERWHGGPDHQVRAVLEMPDVVAVGYRLPDVDLLPTSEEPRVVGHLGPDPLGADWEVDVALANLVAEPDRSISDAVLDQRVMAGIGNVFRCELLFLRGIAPTMRVGDVADPRALVELAAKLLRANTTTGRQITTGNTRRGQEHWVYGRDRQTCRRCGTRIAVRHAAAFPERSTWWCPRCQPS